MKKNLLTAVCVAAGMSSFAQLPVSQTAQNKNVILEEFTGIYCQYCPDGHKKADLLMAANPNDVFVLNIHVGSYAAPTGSDPDFRTSFGTSIVNQTSLTGYPAGTINRHLFSGLSQNTTTPGTAMSRGNWTTAANTILSQASYVNVACEANVDVSTRVITVDVEAYFTGTGAPSSMNLNVALTQDKIEGPQTGGSTWYPAMIQPNGKYLHNKMLRHFLTGQWGDIITTTAQGTLVQRQYTYTIPAAINGVPVELSDLKVISYIAEGQQEIITGSSGPITFTGLNFTNNAKLKSVESDNEVCGSVVAPTVKIQNYGNAVMTAATISYNVNGGTPMTYPWTGSLNSLASATVNLPDYSFNDLGNNTLNVTITDVNGGVDGDMSDNSGTKNNITNTTASSTGTNYTLTVTQDRYGSEITWEIIDNATGSPIPGGTGGPYADLAANGTLARVHNVTLSNTGCYTFNIYDSYGDGINSGYGAGNVRFENSNSVAVFINNGQYTSSYRKPFEITSLIAGIKESDVASEFTIYPNPTNDKSTISFYLTESSLVNMDVYNTMGSIVYSSPAKTMNVGNQQLIVDATELPNGIYFVNLTIGNQIVTKKISVLK
jgi:hypothetical protein